MATELDELIDRAAKAAGSDYALAKLIGQPRQRISDWRHARTSCSPEDQALMASIAGLDPVIELARAIVKKHEGTEKGDRLMRALGKALPAIGAVLGSAGAGAAQIGSKTSDLIARFIQCIESRMPKSQFGLCKVG